MRVMRPTYDASDPKAGQPVLAGDEIFSPGEKDPDVQGVVKEVRERWIATEHQGFVPQTSRIFSAPPSLETALLSQKRHF
jgi:hypothetical protein